MFTLSELTFSVSFLQKAALWDAWGGESSHCSAWHSSAFPRAGLPQTIRAGTLSPKHGGCLEGPRERQGIGQCLYGKVVNRGKCMSRISLLLRQCPQVGIYKLDYNSRYMSQAGHHLSFQPHPCPAGKLLFSLPGEEILKYPISLSSPLWYPGRPTEGQPRLWDLAHHRTFDEGSHKKSLDSNGHQWLSGFPA